MAVTLGAFALALVAYVAADIARDFFRAHSKKVGGLTFFAYRRIRFSFCVVRRR